MAKFNKLNGFLDRALQRMDELGDDEIQRRRNTPEAKARQAAWRAEIEAAERRAMKRRVRARAVAADVARGLAIGQTVRTRRGELLQVVSVEDSAVLLSNGKRFAATMLTAF